MPTVFCQAGSLGRLPAIIDRDRLNLMVEQTLTEGDDLFFTGHMNSSQSAPALAAPNVFAFSRTLEDHDRLFRRRPARAAGDQIWRRNPPPSSSGRASWPLSASLPPPSARASLEEAQARLEGVRQDVAPGLPARRAEPAIRLRVLGVPPVRHAVGRSLIRARRWRAAKVRGSGTLYSSAIFCIFAKRDKPLSARTRNPTCRQSFPAGCDQRSREERPRSWSLSRNGVDRIVENVGRSASAAQPAPCHAPSSPSRSPASAPPRGAARHRSRRRRPA